MDKKYVVELPIRHIKSLSNRWDIDKFYENNCGDYRNDQPCVLCKVHNTDYGGCNNCPLARFGSGRKSGCLEWLKLIRALTRTTALDIGTESVTFDENKYKIAVRQLKRLTETALQYIVWK